MEPASETTASVSKQLYLIQIDSNIDVLKAPDKLIFKMFKAVVG